jgi:hypothetical protein
MKNVQSSAYDFRAPNKGKPQPKKLRNLSVEEAENGGHIVEHHFENNGPAYHDPEQFVFGSGEGDKVLAHIAKHMGIPGAKEEIGEKEHKGKPKMVASGKVSEAEEGDQD